MRNTIKQRPVTSHHSSPLPSLSFPSPSPPPLTPFSLYSFSSPFSPPLPSSSLPALSLSLSLSLLSPPPPLSLSLSLIPSLTCQSFLTALLPLGQELVDTLKSDNKMLTVFKDYITSCILLAGRHSDPGHVGLARAAIEWLPGW